MACLPQLTHCLGTGSCPNHIYIYIFVFGLCLCEIAAFPGFPPWLVSFIGGVVCCIRLFVLFLVVLPVVSVLLANQFSCLF